MPYSQFSSVENIGNNGYFAFSIVDDTRRAQAFSEEIIEIDSTGFTPPLGGGEALTGIPGVYVFLTSYSEDFNATWDTPERAFGRLNPDYRYAQTNRKVSIGFKLAARSVAEAKFNLEYCEQLAKLTYGKYSKSGATTVFGDSRYRYQGANLNLTVYFGSLLRGESCFVNDFAMDMNFDAGVFEFSGTPVAKTPERRGRRGTPIGLFQEESFDVGNLPETSFVYHSDKGKVYPKEINVAINLTILHKDYLGFGGPNRPGRPNYWAADYLEDWPHGAGPIGRNKFPQYMLDEYTIQLAEGVSEVATDAETVGDFSRNIREDPQLGEGLILDSSNNILNGG